MEKVTSVQQLTFDDEYLSIALVWWLQQSHADL